MAVRLWLTLVCGPATTEMILWDWLFFFVPYSPAGPFQGSVWFSASKETDVKDNKRGHVFNHSVGSNTPMRTTDDSSAYILSETNLIRA